MGGIITKYAKAGAASPVTAYGALLLFLKVLFWNLSAEFDDVPATIANWNAVFDQAVVTVLFFVTRDAAKSSQESGVSK